MPSRRGWGHSSIEEGLRFFDALGDGSTNLQLAITHHAPARTDRELDRLQSDLLTDGIFHCERKSSLSLSPSDQETKIGKRCIEKKKHSDNSRPYLRLVTRQEKSVVGSRFSGYFLPDNDTKDPNFLIPKENEIFGEMGVIDDELRMADARAMQDSELVSLTKEEFEKIVSGQISSFVPFLEFCQKD